MRASGIVDLSSNRSLLPFSEGKDLTYELLFESLGKRSKSDDYDLVLHLCKRLKKSAQLICNRSRKGKVSYNISDEYDVQDLLQALLRGYLKYSVVEDPIGKMAGTKSARADISVEELGIIIEIKYVRSPNDQKGLLEQYSEDLVLYSQWGPLKELVFMIYNSEDLSDGEALEKLSGSQVISGKSFNSTILLA